MHTQTISKTSTAAARAMAIVTTIAVTVTVWANTAAAQAVQPTATPPPGTIATAVDEILGWLAWALIPTGIAAFLVIGIITAFEIGDSQTRTTWGKRAGKAAGGLLIGGSSAAIVNIFV